MKNYTLSTREKVMLYILAMFLLVVGGIVLLVLPMLDSYNQTKEAVEQMKNLEATVVGQTTQLPMLESMVEENRQQVAQLSAHLQPAMEGETLDRAVTALLLQHGLQPVSLRLGEAAPRAVPPYGRREDLDAGGEDFSPEGQPVALAGTAALTCTGTLEDFIAFCDAVAALDGYALTSCSAHSAGEAVAGQGAQSDMEQLFSAELLVYMGEMSEA